MWIDGKGRGSGEEAEEEAGERSSDIGIEQDNEKVKFFSFTGFIAIV